MQTIDHIAGLHPDTVSHADLVKAVLELAAEVKDLKRLIASGLGGAMNAIDPARMAEVSGQT